MRKKNTKKMTWRELNTMLLEIKTDAEAKALLDTVPSNFKHRAYSRYSRLRRQREHQEMRAQQ
jgi:hypothetical protein